MIGNLRDNAVTLFTNTATDLISCMKIRKRTLDAFHLLLVATIRKHHPQRGVGHQVRHRLWTKHDARLICSTVHLLALPPPVRTAQRRRQRLAVSIHMRIAGMFATTVTSLTTLGV
jgi:hypothetical protein